MMLILFIRRIWKQRLVLGDDFIMHIFFINNKGAAALLTVVIIGAATLIMAVSASFLGLGELDLGYTAQKNAEVFNIADGCMEEAMRHLRIDSTYAGAALSLGDGSCIISVVAVLNDRTITVEAALGAYNKKIEASLTLTGNVITLNSWQEKEN